MPRYDYKCKQCGHQEEHTHSFKEDHEFLCMQCERSVMTRLIGTPGIAVKHTRLKQMLKDNHRKETEMRQDLRENHMVEKVAPVGAKNIAEVHREVKASGSLVRDSMQRTIEENETKKRKKQKEWQIGANKRVEKRTIEARKKRAEAEAAKRKITVSTK